MEPRLNISLDPSFYFQNVDYNDYRELVCFERPACFALHYYFGFSCTRLWLFDRFAFEFNGTDLVGRSNALSDFLYDEAVISDIELKPEVQLRDFLNREISSMTSLIAPLTAQIGSSTVVTSLTLDRLADETVDCTSLRGDDFFIGKSIALAEIEKRLYFENERVKFHRLSIPRWMRENAERPSELWARLSLAEKFRSTLQVYYKQNGDRGWNHLQAYSESRSRHENLETFVRKAGEGFTNVLLVEYFWPMLFAYSPFHVFLRYVLREDVHLGLALDREALKKTLDNVFLQAQQITNIAYMFGRHPCERNFERFTAAMTGMIDLHAAVESELAKAVGVE